MIYRNNCSLRLAFLSLSLLFFLGSELAAQPTKDPQQDLSVNFSTKRSGDDPGTVVGSVKNRSANTYPCVRVEFDLLTRFDLRTPGEKAQHLGVLLVEVQDLVPHGEREFQQPLSFPAGVGVKSVSECSAQPTKEPPTKEPPTKEPPAPRPPTPKPPAPDQGETSPPTPPVPPATCSITGRISGKLKWDTKDDRGQPVSFTLTHMFLRAPGTARPEHVEVQGRKYTFNKVPAGKSYNISAGSFRSEPREKTVSCRPGSTHVGIDFKITGPPPSG